MSCVTAQRSGNKYNKEIRHYSPVSRSYIGKSIVYDNGDRIHIRTYDARGKLISTSDGRR